MTVRNIRLNLLPPEFRPTPTVTAFPIVFGILVGLGLLFMIITYLLTQSKVSGLESRIASYKQEIEVLKPVTDEYDTIVAAKLDIDKRKAMFSYIDKNYVYWPDFIASLTPLVPDNVWITELGTETLNDHENGGKVKIIGNTKDGKVLPVAFFMQNLKTSGIFSDVKLEQTQVQFINDLPVQEFTIEVQVKGVKDYTPPPPAKPKSDASGGSPNPGAPGTAAAAKPGAT